MQKTRSDKVYCAFVNVILMVLTVVALYPIYFMIIASISDPVQTNVGNVVFLPKGINFEAYRMLYQRREVWIGYRNTLFYTFVGTIINLFVTIPAAYALSRKDLYKRKMIALFFLFTMYFNGGLIPTYLNNQRFGMVNSIWIMLIPDAVNVFNLIIAKNFFENAIPDSLRDAATIDGANDFVFFSKIALPLAKTMLAVQILYYALEHWNIYFTPMIYISDPELQVLQVVIKNLMASTRLTAVEGMPLEAVHEQLKTSELLKYAVVVVSMIPMLILYPLIQKRIVGGVLTGAIKG